MLRIDCLLLNTDYHNGLKQAIRYIAGDMIENGKKADFRSVFRELRKADLEVDIETAGHLYNIELDNTTHADFSTPEEIAEITGEKFAQTTENLLKKSPIKGEKQIGELGPMAQIVKSWVDAFANAGKMDISTKSILRTIQDIASQTFTRDLDKQDKPQAIDTRPFAEKMKEWLERNNVGFKDNTTNMIRNLSDLHQAMKKELQRYTDSLRKAGATKSEIAAWENHIDNFMQSTYSLALTSKEANETLMQGLKEKGFTTLNKKGEEIINWKKLAGEYNNQNQLRQAVFDAMKSHGFQDNEAHIVADALKNEYRKMIAKNYEKLQGIQQAKVDSWTEAAQQGGKRSIKDIVEENITAWKTLKGYPGRENEQLIFGKNYAKRIIGEAIRDSVYGKDTDSGRAVDFEKLAIDNPSDKDLEAIVKDYLIRQGITEDNAEIASKNIGKSYGLLRDDIVKHGEKRQGTRIKSHLPLDESQKTPVDLNKLINDRVDESSNLNTLQNKKPDEFAPGVSKSEGTKLLKETFKENGLTNPLTGNLDMQKISEVIDNRQGIYDKIAEQAAKYLENKKFNTPEEKAEAIKHLTDSMTTTIDSTFDKLRAYVQGKREAIENSWDIAQSQKPAISEEEMINKGVFEFDRYKTITGDTSKPLLFRASEANKILSKTIKDAGYSKDLANGKTVIDYEKLSKDADSIKKIAEIAEKEIEKLHPNNYKEIVDALHKQKDSLFDKLKEYEKAKQEKIDAAWLKNNTPNQKNTIFDTINKRINDLNAYLSKGLPARDLRFTPTESRQILGHVLGNTKEFGKEDITGKKSISWIKSANESPLSPADLNKMVYEGLKNDIGDIKAQQVADAMSKSDVLDQFHNDVAEHSKSILNTQQASIGKSKGIRKSDLQKMLELESLGAFSGAYDKLTMHALGIKVADQHAIFELQKIADETRKLFKVFEDYPDAARNHAFANLQKRITKLLVDNNYSKNFAYKAIKIFRDVVRTGNLFLISRPLNVFENSTSGWWKRFDSNRVMIRQLGKNIDFGKQLYWAMLKDVAYGGLEFGGHGDKFVAHVDLLNKLDKVDFSIDKRLSPLQNTGKVIKSLVTLPVVFMRGLSSGVDAANKVVMRNEQLVTMIHKALTDNETDKINKELAEGKISSQMAETLKAGLQEKITQQIVESYFGKKHEETLNQARKIIADHGDEIGLKEGDKQRERAAIRLANDMDLMSLKLNTNVTDDMLNAALNSSMHAVGVNLGHEANNQAAENFNAGKIRSIQAEQKALQHAKETGDYKEVNKQNIWNMVVFDEIRRLAGGGMNWMGLRLSAAGLGLTSMFGKVYNPQLAAEKGINAKDGKLNVYKGEALDYSSPEKMQESFRQYQRANFRAMSAITGVSRALALTALIGAGGALRTAFGTKHKDEPEEENPFESAFQGVKHNYLVSKGYDKIAGALELLLYHTMITQGAPTDRFMTAVGDAAVNVLNLNDRYTMAGQASDILRDMRSGDPKAINKAYGMIGGMAGSLSNPFAPMVSTGNEWVKIIKYAATGEDPTYNDRQAYDPINGFFQGGLMQRAGMLDRLTPIYALPGVGVARADVMVENGYKTMSDIEKGFETDPDKAKGAVMQALGIKTSHNGKMHATPKQLHAYALAIHELRNTYGCKNISKDEEEGWNEIPEQDPINKEKKESHYFSNRNN